MKAKVGTGRSMRRKRDKERLLRWEERQDGPKRKQDKYRRLVERVGMGGGELKKTNVKLSAKKYRGHEVLKKKSEREQTNA